MEISVFIARLIGPFFCVAGLGILMNISHYREMIRDLAEDSGLLYIGGGLALITGMALVLTHNKWVPGWPGNTAKTLRYWSSAFW